MTQLILLVDDDENLLSGISRFFHNEPYELLTANSAEKALEVVNSVKINVMVTDHQMPGMSGLELLASMKKKFPHIIKLMLTGNADLNMAIEAINSGDIYRFLTKPCSAVELGVAIRQALEHQQLVSQAWKLLNKVKQQNYYLDRLEQINPGIGMVMKSDEGTILLKDEEYDIELLIKELESQVNM